MKKLSRIEGFKDSEIVLFNKMYESLIERIFDSDEEADESFYSQTELSSFRNYVILAEADESKRSQAMRYKRSLADFTPDEINRFDHMQGVLEEFNRLLDDPDIEIRKVLPLYSDIEMAEHSQYREIWLGHQCRELYNE